MLALYNNEQQDTAHAIAEQCQLSPSMVSKSLESLKKAGLIEAEKDRSDNRIAHIRLTVQAKPIITRLSRAQTHFITEIVQGISAEDFGQVVRLAEQMQNNLCRKPELAAHSGNGGRTLAAPKAGSDFPGAERGGTSLC